MDGNDFVFILLLRECLADSLLCTNCAKSGFTAKISKTRYTET